MSSSKHTFTNFPHLKLGFTTHNFTATTPVTEEEIVKFVDYAVENGFSWFELRDPHATLSLEECDKISTYAKKREVEIAYSNQRSFLDPDFFDIYQKGVENATLFAGPNIIRGHISGKLFDENPGKIGLNAEEFEEIINIVRKASTLAHKKGLSILVENGAEAFFIEDESIFGTAHFLDATQGIVDFQLDTANAFSGNKPYPNPDRLLDFVEKNISRLKYIHLKSSKDGDALPYLQDSELDYERLFSMMSRAGIPYIAIELATVDSLEEVMHNHEKSILYLKEKGYLQ